MTILEFKRMLTIAADNVIDAESELTEIDSKFGDADHGITMSKIMANIKKAIENSPEDIDFKDLLEEVSMAAMAINGGAAVPLWSTFFEGMCEGAPHGMELSTQEFKEIFKTGYHTLSELSKARVGGKTLMDALIPAVEAIESTEGEIVQIMEKAAKAANDGAKASEGYVSKFGRAKSYKEQTIGTPDAGAMSMKYFFEGMYKSFL